eukprot:6351426-Pyramimonas_sp.AAC.1
MTTSSAAPKVWQTPPPRRRFTSRPGRTRSSTQGLPGSARYSDALNMKKKATAMAAHKEASPTFQ